MRSLSSRFIDDGVGERSANLSKKAIALNTCEINSWLISIETTTIAHFKSFALLDVELKLWNVQLTVKSPIPNGKSLTYSIHLPHA